MAGLFNKLTNFLMPEEEIDESETTESAVREDKKIRNSPEGKQLISEERGHERPFLTVHTNKIPELKVRICEPESFEEANIIADALHHKEAVLVNYENVAEKEQRRLCDFVNGSCYILKGDVQRISENIVLYVPAHVEISKELCAYTVPAYVKSL